MTIRPAAERDAAALAALRYRFRAGLEPAVEDEAHFVARCERWMADRLRAADRWRCWVAESGGVLLGCVWLALLEKVPNPVAEAEEHGYVSNLYVAPSARRAGLGGALLDEALRVCRERRVDAVLLWPTTESRSLYRRHGFAARSGVFVLDNHGGLDRGGPPDPLV